jgi:hypothetical protein
MPLSHPSRSRSPVRRRLGRGRPGPAPLPGRGGGAGSACQRGSACAVALRVGRRVRLLSDRESGSGVLVVIIIMMASDVRATGSDSPKRYGPTVTVTESLAR